MTPGITINDCILAASAAWQVQSQDITGPSRIRYYVLPRYTAIKLARCMTDKSLPVIGAAMGGRDHTSIRHALLRFDELILDDTFADRYDVALRALSNVEGLHAIYRTPDQRIADATRAALGAWTAGVPEEVIVRGLAAQLEKIEANPNVRRGIRERNEANISHN